MTWNWTGEQKDHIFIVIVTIHVRVIVRVITHMIIITIVISCVRRRSCANVENVTLETSTHVTLHPDLLPHYH